MVTGASDNQLRVWALGMSDEDAEGRGVATTDGADDNGVEGARDEDVVAVYMGSVARQGNGKKVMLLSFVLFICWCDCCPTFPLRDGCETT